MVPGLLPPTRSRTSWRRLGAVVVTVVFAAALPAVSAAQGEPPSPDDSAVIQYTELVPTGTGPKASGVGRERRSSLPQNTKQALASAPAATANALTSVATSSNYGAPSTRTTRQKPKPRSAPSPTDELSLDRTLSATAVAAAPVDDARLIGLLVTLLAIVVGGGALAIRNRRA